MSNKLYCEEETLKPPAHHANNEDAGYDLINKNSTFILQPFGITTVPTGVSLELDRDTFGYITGRSSLNQQGIIVHQGVIDPGYRGELKVVLQNLSPNTIIIEKGQRIAQVLLLPFKTFGRMIQGKANIEGTQRQDKGFGSTNDNTNESRGG